MEIIKTHSGYKVKINDLYIANYYNKKYTFTRDYTYAKTFSYATAKKHLNKWRSKNV